MKSSAPRKPRILIIDDDQTVIKLTTAILTTNGYEVLSAAEAPAGLEMAMKQYVDLIILDVMIPIINGYNVCRLLKSQEKYKKIPIILLTSRTEDEDRKIGEEVGADAYIAKPLEREHFLNLVKQLLNKKS